MTFIDRVPMYPGRVRLVPVPGQENTFDMIRADEPLIEGTPLNKALFDGIDAEMTALRQLVSDTVFSISQRVSLENVAVGTEIGLYENGVLVPFIKIKNSYEGDSGSLVMRKNCVTKMPLMNPGDTKYENCRADLWLTNEYFQTLDEATKAVALEATFSVRVTEGSSSFTDYIGRKVFLLSSYEHSTPPSSDISYEGEQIAYFNSSQRRTAMDV